ncbi:MAG: TRAP transporter large permease [Rubrivivax sp.]|jgi:tripartite ATP-independent transporter DctM subunit
MVLTIFIGAWLLLVLIGTPIGVSMILASLGYFAWSGTGLNFAAQRMVDGLNSFPIIAVPLFILAANLFNASGITHHIFGFANALVGHIRGGMGHVNILASLFFSGMSGSALADAGGLGKIEAEAMHKVGYPAELAGALTSVSAILGPLVPPSIPMVVYGVVSGASIGGLFLGGIVPGLLCTAAMMAMLYVIAGRRRLPVERRKGAREVMRLFVRSFPALLTPVVIIGGIFSGFFSPTEAAAVTVVYAVLVSRFIYGEMSWQRFWACVHDTAIMSATIALIIGGVSMMGVVLAMEKAPDQLAQFFTGIASGPTEFMVLVCLMLLVLGCFIEVLALLLVLVPSLVPVALGFGVDPVHFGVVVIFTLMLGTLTPPMGMVLFVVAQSHGLPVHRLAVAVLPWLAPMVAVLALMIFVPATVTALPGLFL